MIDFDDMDDIFRRIQDMMNSDFSGGYSRYKGGNYRDYGIDIQEDDKYIYMTVELRVRDEDLTVTPNENAIILEVMMDGSWNKRIIRLPSPVDPKSAKISFINCILDVKLKKIKGRGIKNNVNEGI